MTHRSDPSKARDGSGKTVDPRDGVIPVMKEVGEGKLTIVGTGFYVARYGLFVTAQHVLVDLVDMTKRRLGIGYIIHLTDKKSVHFRRILKASLLQPADLAIGQADNYLNQYPNNPLSNRRAILTGEVPIKGSRVITYAYPENEILDFTRGDHTPNVVSDYYEGEFLEYVTESPDPFMPYPHYTTSIELKSGASGGPVFDRQGRVIGVNCRGWDFGEAEHEPSNLSSIVPVTALLDMRVDLLQLPPNSWEYAQVAPPRPQASFTVSELVGFGHIDFRPGADGTGLAGYSSEA